MVEVGLERLRRLRSVDLGGRIGRIAVQQRLCCPATAYLCTNNKCPFAASSLSTTDFLLGTALQQSNASEITLYVDCFRIKNG